MASAQVYASAPDAPMELDPKHPGVHDAVYVERRKQLYDLAYRYRVGSLGWPEVTYTEEEHALWRAISERLVPAHEQLACGLYKRGKALLNIEQRFMPQLGELSDRLQAHHDFGLVPAEGLITKDTFFGYLSQRQMPCTQFLRHPTVPEFTPEPDAVHDVIGHVPCLMDAQYTEIVAELGRGRRDAAPEWKSAWGRMYWFTIEFGLIEEAGELKVFGAGLLSSLQEIEYCYSDRVKRIPLTVDGIVNTMSDATLMQPNVFVIASMEQLAEDIQTLRRLSC